MPYYHHLARLLIAASLLSLLLLQGCAHSSQSRVQLRGEWFKVEIADDDASRTRGLMFRRDLPADQGMLFIFPDEEMRGFWMKNTYISLDILYFDSQLRLVSMHQRVPPCGDAPICPSYPSLGPAKYVLELNAGVARRLGAQPGDLLRLSGVRSAGNAAP